MKNLKAQYNMQLLTTKEKLKSKLLAFPDVFPLFCKWHAAVHRSFSAG
jgi:hypothetical protein